MPNIWLLLLPFVLSIHAQAEPVLKKVIDGDTVIILDQGRTYHLRLLDIDAPESQQSFGKQSKRTLMALCNSKITVRAIGTDPYGRTLGHLYCNRTAPVNIKLHKGWPGLTAAIHLGQN